MTTILTLVKNGLGVSVVPEHVLPKNHPYHLLELPELPKSEISMTTLNYKTMPPAIAELSEIIRG
jgi:DNA-binding transcriptional LysR family regulator